MKPPFVQETWEMVVPTSLAGIAFFWGGLHFSAWWLTLLGLVVLVLAGLMLNFFRDFERKPERELDPKEVLSPADGKVVVLKVEKEGFYLKRPCLHLAIFMNPLNNHVQRAPYNGKVLQREYHPGEFIGAYDDKADLKNEQAHLVVELTHPVKGKKSPGKMVVKQIAGFLCRRVKTTPQAGEKIVRGERIGRILLGSRVDLFLPVNFKPAVQLGDQVRVGVTILGELK